MFHYSKQSVLLINMRHYKYKVLAFFSGTYCFIWGIERWRDDDESFTIQAVLKDQNQKSLSLDP